MSYEEMRTYFCSCLKSNIGRFKDRPAFEISVPCSLPPLKVLIRDEIFSVLKELLTKTGEKADKVIKTLEPDRSGLFPKEDPLYKGYLALRLRLEDMILDYFDNPDLHIERVLENVLSFDNDIFTNREGSSPTKKRNNFNRLARLVEGNLKRSPSKFDQPVNLGFDVDLDFGSSFLFKAKLTAQIKQSFRKDPFGLNF